MGENRAWENRDNIGSNQMTITERDKDNIYNVIGDSQSIRGDDRLVPVCLSLCLSVCLYIYLSVSLSVSQFNGLHLKLKI